MTAADKKFMFDRVFSEDEKEIPFSEIPEDEHGVREPYDYSPPEEGAIAEPENEVEEAPEEPPAPTFSEEELAQARDDSFAAGKEEAAREAAESLEAQLAKALDNIADNLVSLQQDSHNAQDASTGEAVVIAGAIVRKLLPAADPELAAGEILHVVETAMGRLYEEPTVSVRVNDSLIDLIGEKIRDASQRKGYSGTLTVSGDPSLPVSDCRLEWGAGGVERDLGAMWAEVEDIIARNTGVHLDDVIAQEAPSLPEEPATESLSESDQNQTDVPSAPLPEPEAGEQTEPAADLEAATTAPDEQATETSVESAADDELEKALADLNLSIDMESDTQNDANSSDQETPTDAEQSDPDDKPIGGNNG